MFKFIVRNTNNYELQKTTTMHNNTVHTHMIEIITEKWNDDYYFPVWVCLEASNLFYKLNSYYLILCNHSGTKHTKLLSLLKWWLMCHQKSRMNKGKIKLMQKDGIMNYYVQTA